MAARGDPDVHTAGRSEAGRARVAAFADERRAALRQALLRLLAGFALAAAAIWAVRNGDLWAMGWIVAVACLIIAAIAAARPLRRQAAAFAEALAPPLGAALGLDHCGGGVPAGYEQAAPLLFPFAPEARFSHLFRGSLDGRAVDLAQAHFSWAKNHMRGRVYGFERTGGPAVLVVPNAGLVGRLRETAGLQRVDVSAEPDFASRFQAYSAEPVQAAQWLNGGRRALLLELWRAGPAGRRGSVYAWFGSDRGFVFVGGADLFGRAGRIAGPGAEARAAGMAEELEDAARTAERLARALG